MLQDLRELVEKMEPDGGALLDDPGKKNAGSSEVVQPGPLSIVGAVGAANEELIVSVKGEDEQASVVSVTLTSPEPTVDGTGGTATGLFASVPVARVEWGVGRTQAVAFIDYINGAQFSVPASYLRVYARNEYGPTPAGTPAQAVFPVKLGAFVSYLTLKNIRVQRTLSALIPTATATIFVVPPFATDVQVFRVGNPAPAFTADFSRSIGPIVTLYTIPVAAGAVMPETVLANGVRFIIITHAAGADVMFNVVFRLAL